MNKEKTLETVEKHFESWYVKGMEEFIRIPNLTTMCDPTYLENGEMEKCIDLVDKYVQMIGLKGLERQIFNLKDCKAPPLIVYTIEGKENEKNTMIYGHLDKQPYGIGWDDDKQPTNPVRIDDRLYGRGGADDGYSVFSAMLALKAIQDQGVSVGRVVVVLETEEESGSPHLVRLLQEANDYIGKVDVCICMDSGAIDYEQMWVTSSLRGVVMVDFNVTIGKDGYHSGEVGGVVPETFRVVRQLLDRVDDSLTGQVNQCFQTPVPEWKQKEAEELVEMKGKELCTKYELVNPEVKYCDEGGLVNMYLNNTWKANLSVTGIQGLPPLASAGNVVRSSTGMRISMRVGPDMDSALALERLKNVLTNHVPYNAQVDILQTKSANGWQMQQLTSDLEQTLNTAGAMFFDGKSAKKFGNGGSIPFLCELGIMYPGTQIVALGLLGPKSNAHGPNEMLQLTYARKLTCALAHILQSI